MVNSKQKGKRGELELAAALREMGFKGARRGQQFKGTPESPDIADAIPGVHVECKRTETLSLYKALEQAKGDAGDGEVPIVAHRRNGKEWVVVVQLDRLIDLAEKIHRREPPPYRFTEEDMKDVQACLPP
jgi:Holliday junction resolvase